MNSHADRSASAPEAPLHPLTFDGERFIPGRQASEIDLEHYHRYAAVADTVRGASVLDVACGAGYGSKILAATAKNVVGVDIAPEAVASANLNYAGSNIRFIQSDCTDLPLDDGMFDFVTSFETIEHIKAHDAFLDECRRVLKPDGVLIISTPDKGAYNAQLAEPNPHHLKELSREEFERLLSKRFAHVSIVGQRVVFGSVIVGDGPAENLESLRGAGVSIDRSTVHARSIYLIATCSNGPTPRFPAGIYEGSFPPNALSSLIGGIRERDEAVAKAAIEKDAAAQLIERLEFHLAAVNEELRQAQLGKLDAEREIAFSALALAESRLVAEILRLQLESSEPHKR